VDLDRKRLLISGVEGELDVALPVAALAQELGAEVLLACSMQAQSLAEYAGRHPSAPPDALELDIGRPEGREELQAEVSTRWGRLDGAVQASAYVPPLVDGAEPSGDEMENAESGFLASAYSLNALARGVLPLMEKPSGSGGSIVGVALGRNPARPADDWFGGTAALEAVNRYLACQLGPRGVRVNLVAAGPPARPAAEATPGFGSPSDAIPVARAVCFLLSEWSRAVSGELLHVDGMP